MDGLHRKKKIVSAEDAMNFYSDLTSSGRSYYLPVSKGLSGFLRHNKIRSLFSSTGSVELSNIIANMNNKPSSRRMTGREFAAMLMSNNKSRFFVEIHVNWQWNPYTSPPTEPFEIRIGCHQGHSNQAIDP